MRNELIPPLLGYYTMAGGESAVVPWYLSGGVASANCIAAYQPIGAADYAASKVNLANPGTYDAGDGTAYPTWNDTNGWIFNGSTQYLTSGILATESMSVIIRFSDATKPENNYPTLFGTSETTRCFYIHTYSGISHYYVHGSNAGGYTLQVIGNLSSGVVAMAGYKAYKNGILETGTGDPGGWSGTATKQMFIGARRDGDSAAYHYAGHIQAMAFYATKITADQVAALTAAVAAL